jgi:hypothetical protein
MMAATIGPTPWSSTSVVPEAATASPMRSLTATMSRSRRRMSANRSLASRSRSTSTWSPDGFGAAAKRPDRPGNARPSTTIVVVKGVISDGLITTALPAINAGAESPIATPSG